MCLYVQMWNWEYIQNERARQELNQEEGTDNTKKLFW